MYVAIFLLVLIFIVLFKGESSYLVQHFNVMTNTHSIKVHLASPSFIWYHVVKIYHHYPVLCASFLFVSFFIKTKILCFHINIIFVMDMSTDRKLLKSYYSTLRKVDFHFIVKSNFSAISNKTKISLECCLCTAVRTK